MVAGLTVKSAPANGFWRIGRGADPLNVRLPEPETLLSSQMGNRFDSPSGHFATLYFCTTLEGCFGETLARLRPDLKLQALIQDEWAELGFMKVGDVPAEWRQRRTAVRATVAEGGPSDFLDVDDIQTIQMLRSELAFGLSSLGTTIWISQRCEDRIVA